LKIFEFLWVYPALLLLALIVFRKTHVSDLWWPQRRLSWPGISIAAFII
jgi:hypothetical protein